VAILVKRRKSKELSNGGKKKRLELPDLVQILRTSQDRHTAFGDRQRTRESESPELQVGSSSLLRKLES